MAATSTPTSNPPASAADPGQFVELVEIGWDQYVAISEAIGERPNPRLIYCDGRLEIVVTSRRHDWFAERLGDFVKIVAGGCGIDWEDAGTATYRRADEEVGVEGDKTFYLGAHAERMKGALDIDLDSQPPPDLAIEVEVSHSANQALKVWGRLGVPEVWRFDPMKDRVTFWRRKDDGTFEAIERSLGLPGLRPVDVLEQLRLADSIGAGEWFGRLNDWVREVIRPRLDQAR
ncbi:Uma2 family endonuclease [Tautonia marina]|uniref:Uma2 family endonuclease n=1 Tax=Tautonia marina TaxID=2653855 RepID=UPI001260D072|nr:Uma2 family endonuclease [Tautonia marina]